MTDDTRLDARVRGALADLPMPDDHETRAALQTVLKRSRRPRLSVPPPRSWLPPVLAATAVAILAALATLLGSGAQQPEPGPSHSPASDLVGTWSHRVSGAVDPTWNGRWRMVLARDGVLTLRGPAAASASSDGASYDATAGRVRIDAFVNSVCNEMAAGVYTWSLRQGTLTVALVDDPCPARAALFAGAWLPIR